MKILILLSLALLTLSCQEKKNDSDRQLKKNTISNPDTIIGNRPITNEIAGSAYRTRAKGYFIIVKKDTSDFMPIFTESKENKKIGIDIRYEKKSLTYNQRFDELKRILPQASTDFCFDSLKTIFIGRLILSGDLAIKVTNQYRQAFGENEKIEDYQKVSQFLLESKLTTDLNKLLNTYNISVDKVYPEKIFFTTKKDLCRASKIETDSTSVPEKILDCLIWVGLKRN